MKMRCLKELLQGFILVACVSIYPVVFMFCANAEEIQLGEVLPIAGGFVGIGLLIWLFCLALIRKKNKSMIVAFLLILLLSNYMLIQNAVNRLGFNLKYWHLLPICIVVLLHIIYFLCRKVKESSLNDVSLVLTIVMAGMILVNIIPAIPSAVRDVNEVKQRVNEDTGNTQEKNANVYWMVFDECGSFPVMREHYSYQDGSVYNALKNRGFSISDTSFNESGNTVSVLTNCLNLDYVVHSGMSTDEIEKWKVDPLLYRMLKEQGYSIYGIGDTGWLGNLESLTMNQVSGAQTIEGFNAEQLILDRTVFAPFLKYDGLKAAKTILDAFEWFSDDTNLKANNSAFYLMYVCAPHQPFLFDENGDEVLSANYSNWADPQYYLGQYIFVMKKAIECVDQIQKKDPDSVIILQSDHGPRFRDGMTHEEKLNILNCVYFRGKPFDQIQGKSGVNTLRMIFEQLWSIELGEVRVHDEE